MKVKPWNDPLAWYDGTEALDSARVMSIRNTRQPMDLFDPTHHTVTREEYYRCLAPACTSSPVPAAETPTSPKEPSLIPTSIREGV